MRDSPCRNILSILHYRRADEGFTRRRVREQRVSARVANYCLLVRPVSCLQRANKIQSCHGFRIYSTYLTSIHKSPAVKRGYSWSEISFVRPPSWEFELGKKTGGCWTGRNAGGWKHSRRNSLTHSRTSISYMSHFAGIRNTKCSWIQSGCVCFNLFVSQQSYASCVFNVEFLLVFYNN